MKKIILLLLAITTLTMPTVAADETKLSDELIDTSKMFEYSQTVTCETHNTLGSYAYSTDSTYSITYEIDNISTFSVTTLNYKGEENIKFILSDKDGVKRIELSTADIVKTEISPIASFSRYEYSYKNSEENMRYLTIEIVQSKAKYIRIDSVEIFADVPIEIKQIKYLDKDGNVRYKNIFGAVKTVLTFNQALDDKNLPNLIIKNGETFTEVQPEYDSQKYQLSYVYEPLKFDKYEIQALNITAKNGNTCDFFDNKGYEAVFSIEQYYYQGMKDISLLVSAKDNDNIVFGLENVCFESDNLETAEINENFLKIKKPGDAVITAKFVLDGVETAVEKSIHVSDAEKLIGIDEKITLQKDEELTPQLKLLMDNGQEINTDDLEIYAYVSDNSVLKYENGKIIAMRRGTSSITFKVDYFGKELTKTVTVGIGKPAPDILDNANLKISNNDLIVGQQAHISADGYFENGQKADMFTADIKFYTDNNNCVSINSNGNITALKKGRVSIYAEVTLGLNTIKTPNITLNISDNDLQSTELILTNTTICVMEMMQLRSVSYLQDGKEMTENDVQTEYKTDSDIVMISGNVLTANKTGIANIWVSVSYNGKTVQSEKKQITVLKNGGFVYDNPTMPSGDGYSPDWSGTYSHDDSAWWGVSSKKDNYSVELYTAKWDSFIVYEINGCAKEFTYATKTYLPIKDAFITYVAKKRNDGTPDEWTQIPQELIEYSTEQVNGTYGYFHYDNTEGYLDDAGFIKICFPQKEAVEATEGSDTVKIPGAQRFVYINIVTDNAPKVCGVYLSDQNGMTGDIIERAIIKFDQQVNPDGLEENIKIEEKNTGNKVAYESKYENGEYVMEFDALDNNKEYFITVNNVVNAYGKEMKQEYQEQLLMPKRDIEISIARDENNLAAEIHSNLSAEIKADILCAVYDEQQRLKGIKLLINATLSSGSNQINFDLSEYSGFSSFKLYALKNIEMLEQY